MLRLTAADRPLLARARARGYRVLRQLGPDTYEVSGSRPDVPHLVWLRGDRGSCDCPLNTLGRKRCPHIALAAAFVAYVGLASSRQQAVATARAERPVVQSAQTAAQKGDPHAA